MKRLWKTILPCLSDVLGFEAVLNATDGFGIIDDPSRYKPVGWGRGGQGSRGGHRQERSFAARNESSVYMRGDWHGGRGGRGGHGGHGNGDLRVTNSDIRNADIITGTEQKVLNAYEERARELGPSFVLLCHAPSSSMIGSDLEANATQIREMSGTPAAYVNVDGGKDYLYGVGMTLETMGKLLLEKRETIPGTVNLLGCNTIDWTEDMRQSAVTWLADNGFRVLACWGMKETAESLKASAAAEKNLVVSEAGLRLAKHMENEFGIPYVVGAPFGCGKCRELVEVLNGIEWDKEAESTEGASVLVIGEQLMANAIRDALRERGHRAVRVLSLFDMDKALMEPGDAKLNSEDELKKQLNAETVRLVFGDPDLKPLMEKDARWISLPNSSAMFAFESVAAFDMVGGKLDAWLDRELKGEE